jgi:hypothetical protein
LGTQVGFLLRLMREVCICHSRTKYIINKKNRR